MAKEKKAAWCKMYLHQSSLMDAVPDDVLARAMKAAMHYFDTGIKEPLPPLEGAVFAALKPFMDEAVRQYAQDVENGKKSASIRKAAKEGKPPSKRLKQKEKEKDKDKEKEEEEEEEISFSGAKPPSPSPFIPPDINLAFEIINYRYIFGIKKAALVLPKAAGIYQSTNSAMQRS